MEVAAAKALGAGLGRNRARGPLGIGIGNIFSAMVSTVGRNPAARDAVFPIGILGFALTEAVALFALLIRLLDPVHLIPAARDRPAAGPASISPREPASCHSSTSPIR